MTLLRSLASLSLIAGVAQSASGQALQSSDGKGALVLRAGGAISFNLAEKSTELGYVYQTSGVVAAGAGIKLTAVEGLLAIFDQDDAVRFPEGESWVTLGLRFDDVWFLPTLDVYLNGRFRHATYRLVDTSAAASTVAVDSSFNGLRAQLSLFSLLGSVGPVDVGLGVAWRYGRQNNFRTIGKFELCERIPIAAADPTVQEGVRCEERRLIEQFEADEGSEVAADLLLHIPGAQSILGAGLGIDGFIRYDELRLEDDWSGGFALYLSKKGAPQIPLIGFTFQWFGADLRLGIQAGFPFGIEP